MLSSVFFISFSILSVRFHTARLHTPNTTPVQIKERVAYTNGNSVTGDQAKAILRYYDKLNTENGVYNPRHLPFALFAEIQKKYNSVGWVSMQH